jgi:molecular chaperone HscB
VDYFEFYDLPIAFQLDDAVLKRRFYQKSRQYHPDFHTQADTAQQAAMLERSTFNNDAYQTLADPDRRMRYILQLKDVLGEEGSQKLPQDFLLDMMDINEGLMDLQMDFDADRYAGLRTAIDQIEADLDDTVRPLLDRWQDTPAHAADLVVVRNFYLKKRYLLRIRENLANFAAQL